MRRRFFRHGLAFWSSLLAIGLLYAEPLLLERAPVTTRAPNGYYGELTDAFLSGQLNLKVNVDPRLLRSDNPYASRPDVPRPHDASFYKGRIFLYFGAAPVVLVYLPWRIITGTWLADRAGTILFCFLGVTLGAILLRRLRDRHFPRCGQFWLVLAVAVLGLGSPVYYLAQNVTFYAVPVSCAFFSIMLMAVSAERALSAKAPGGRAGWMAVASVAFGLAVGSRPNYLYALPVFLLLSLYAARRARRSEGVPGFWRVLAAAILPLAFVGATIAAYNYLRFESPFEFGARYAFQGGGGDMRRATFFGTRYLKANLSEYLFGTVTYARYFPFFLAGQAYGMALYLPVTLLAPFFLLWMPFNRGSSTLSIALALCATCVGIFACNLLSLGLFYFFGELRYMADFAPSALLAGAIAGFALLDRLSTPGRPSRSIVRLAVAACSIVSILNGTLVALQAVPSARISFRLARCLDYPAYWFERMTGAKQGPVALELEFPTAPTGHREPLLSTGLAGRGDIIYLEYLPDQRGRVGFFHLGSGGPTSGDFPLGPGLHRLDLALGSLYPPRESPQWEGYSKAEVENLKRHLEVRMDGNALLNTSAVFYFSSPGLLHLGANPLARDVSDAVFTGRISRIAREGLPPKGADLGRPAESGPLRLHVRFPGGKTGRSEPLVCTGEPAAGDIFLVTYLEGGRIRFDHEDMGSLVSTEPVNIDFDREHVIDLDMGSLYPPHASFPGLSTVEVNDIKNRYRVWLDGQLLINVPRRFQPSESNEVVCAVNTIGASTASESFTGTISSVERIKTPSTEADARWGPLDAWIQFPEGARGTSEPLVETGLAGQGDIIFVSYEDRDWVRFGFDHWSAGGPMGPRLAVDRTKSHHLEITLGSMFPALGDREWVRHPSTQRQAAKGLVRVRLDGVVVLEAQLPTYDVQPLQINFWANTIGASSCNERFTGKVEKMQRAAW